MKLILALLIITILSVTEGRQLCFKVHNSESTYQGDVYLYHRDNNNNMYSCGIYNIVIDSKNDPREYCCTDSYSHHDSGSQYMSMKPTSSNNSRLKITRVSVKDDNGSTIKTAGDFCENVCDDITRYSIVGNCGLSIAGYNGDLNKRGYFRMDKEKYYYFDFSSNDKARLYC